LTQIKFYVGRRSQTLTAVDARGTMISPPRQDRGDKTREAVMKVRYSAALAAGALVFAVNTPARGIPSSRSRSIATPGETIAKALTKGDERKPLLIQISGTCSESILIDRNDVVLTSTSGGTVAGDRSRDQRHCRHREPRHHRRPHGQPAPQRHHGGRVAAPHGPKTPWSRTPAAPGSPAATARAASSTASPCRTTRATASQSESGSATVLNSQVSQNGRHGVGVFDGGSARIGIDNSNNAGGNTISGNAVNGVHIVFGASAFVGMNTISNNAGNGINLTNASVDISEETPSRETRAPGSTYA